MRVPYCDSRARHSGEGDQTVGMDLEDLSLDTVKMFAGDAEKAGYQL